MTAFSSTDRKNPMTLEEAEAECERLRKLAHDAPLNPYRLDANGHRWVEQYSNAWADRSNDWVSACEKRDAVRLARGGGKL